MSEIPLGDAQSSRRAAAALQIIEQGVADTFNPAPTRTTCASASSRDRAQVEGREITEEPTEEPKPRSSI